MASPLCTAYGGTVTTNGVNVSNGDTVDIVLVDHAGVRTWSLEVVGVSDGLDPAGFPITIDQTTKTATVTSPDPWGTLLIRSTVNGGIGPDGQVDPSLSYTFGIYVPANGIYVPANGKRLIATNETIESNAASGWISTINAAIASIPTPPATPTGLRLSDDGSWSGPGFVSIATGNADVTLNSTQYRNGVLRITGALTANRTVTFPLTAGRAWWIINDCTGAFGLVCKGSTGTGVTVPNGGRATVATDGINFYG
jgi:hypothetical protein